MQPIDEATAKLRGTRVTRALPPQGFQAGRPKKPEHLNAIASAKWDELCKMLRQRGQLTKGDANILELFATGYSRWRACNDAIERDGVMITTTVLDNCGEPHQKQIVNPLIQKAAQLENSLRAILVQLSATPVSRERTKRLTPAPPRNATPQPGSVAYALLEEEQATTTKPHSATAPEPFSEIDLEAPIG